MRAILPSLRDPVARAPRFRFKYWLVVRAAAAAYHHGPILTSQAECQLPVVQDRSIAASVAEAQHGDLMEQRRR
ncbi:uncharacterized protein TrAtP1_002073 [Trichoderma atroviride]|uniref:uncharacterized protein n=1 Tax=Hypocrea atroviridis TaxID=63577 RepID=UPI00331F0B05|nr:hypothetical protein TrAtP1_002073 [Trichoderma atroviride]